MSAHAVILDWMPLVQSCPRQIDWENQLKQKLIDPAVIVTCATQSATKHIMLVDETYQRHDDKDIIPPRRFDDDQPDVEPENRTHPSQDLHFASLTKKHLLKHESKGASP